MFVRRSAGTIILCKPRQLFNQFGKQLLPNRKLNQSAITRPSQGSALYHIQVCILTCNYAIKSSECSRGFVVYVFYF